MDNNNKSVLKVVKMVCPPAEDLSVIINNVRCPECGLSFSNEPRLRMHVLKIHEHKNLKKSVKEDVRYHCPEIMCVYSLKSQRYFTTMKYLKQHYLKVHAAKTFACTQCEKSFSTEAVRLAHLRICGVQFICSCSRIFGTYEALLTHGKRMSHSIDEKYKKTLVGRIRAKTPPTSKLVQITTQRTNKPITILPHRVNCATATNSMKIAFDVAVQTDDIKRTKRTPSPSKTCKRRESRQTQTSQLSKDKRARKTVETQTNQGSKATSDIRKSSSSVASRKQRSSFVKEELSLNDNFTTEQLFNVSPLELKHDVGLQDFWEEKNTTLGTQTSPEKDFLDALSHVKPNDLVGFYDRSACLDIADKNGSSNRLDALNYVEDTSSNIDETYSFDAKNGVSRSDPMLAIDNFTDRFSSIETQTETGINDHFFDSGVNLNGRNFALSSNNETQTTENFDNIEQLLYSNTCTQTCNDILPTDLGLSDIQTQTAWPELEDSTITTETQTGSSCRNTNISTISSSLQCRSWITPTNHTETQTELLSIFDEFQ